MTPDTDRIVSRFGARSTALEVIEGIDLDEQRAVGVPATPGDRNSGWAPHVRDPEAAQRLWDVSERLFDAA